MTETHSDMRAGIWRVPECPLLIEYSPAVMDEIRLAVVDAFFSLPRGGAEIGGILFGRHDSGSVRIEAFRPMECEHAMGPTFVLSDKDKSRLLAQLEGSVRDPSLRGLEVVGWYHSHTRSEIFLSELDLEIYKRFFPERWHVALVMRPAGMKPTRAGFFFRESDGAVHSAATYQEFIVAPSAAGQMGGHARPPAASTAAATETAPARIAKRAPDGEPAAPVLPAIENGDALPADTALLRIDALPARRVVEGIPEAEVMPAVEMRPATFVPPAFMLPEEKKPSHVRLWIALGVLAAAGAGAWFTSGSWMRLFGPKPMYLHLQALDRDGQLWIQWDREALSAAEVQDGSLEILDGQSATTIPLDSARLRAGSFHYARRNGVVEVHLTVKTARGTPLEEFTSFYGQPRSESPNAAAMEHEKQTSELAAEAERARGDLKKEELRTAELQRSLDKMREQMRRDEERRRVENQMPAPAAQAAEMPAATHSASQSGNNANARGNTSAAAPVAPPATSTTAQASPPPAAPVNRPLPPADKPAAERPATVPAAAQPVTRPTAPPGVPVPQPASQSASRPATAPAQPGRPTEPSLSGRWVYSRASKSGSAYPPDSATLMLSEAYNQVNGTFTARYKVPKNGKVNPKVNFSFEGPLHAGSSKFTFTAADGAKGEVELIRLPGKQNAIEVVWYSERDKLTFDDIFFRAP